MTREDLQRASDILRQASELAGDEELQERLYDQSNQLAKLAVADRDPDHGRLDRHMNALYEMMQSTDGDLHGHIADARGHVTEFRKTVEGI